jgi:hypothetical protein
MKVFISWSGEQSKEIAEAFRNWLPCVLHAVKPYFSPDDITKGARWERDIAKELEMCRVGLLVLSGENVQAPWVVFEAGALSKIIDKSKVVPLLFGVEPADIKGPLARFQPAKFDAVDIKRVVKMINSALGEQSLEPSIFDKAFRKWWPDLQSEVNKILEKPIKAKETKRSDRDILEEVLSLVRASAKGDSPPHDQGVVRAALEDLSNSYEQVALSIGLNKYMDMVLITDMMRMGYAIQSLAEYHGHYTGVNLLLKARKLLLEVGAKTTQTDDEIPF